MPYRSTWRERGPRRGLVTIASYIDLIDAELARARLESEDIEAVVREPTGFNPLLTAAAGGCRLEVDESDRSRAEEILAQPPLHEDELQAEDEDPDAVRCPRCELTYCSHARAFPPSYPHVLLVLGPLLGRKRWRCHRCEHVWDDPEAGPREMTRLEPGDPRPVFRLRRAHAGLGLLIGAVSEVFVALVVPGAVGAALLPVLMAGGWLVGWAIGADVCSEPRCRARLPPGAEECASCGGGVAGAVRSAAEHHAAAADFRRELAAIRAADASGGVRAPARRRAASRGRSRGRR